MGSIRYMQNEMVNVSHPLPYFPLLQDFSFTDLQQIVYEDDLCLDVPRAAVKTKIDIQMCHYMGGNQKWEYKMDVSVA